MLLGGLLGFGVYVHLQTGSLNVTCLVNDLYVPQMCMPTVTIAIEMELRWLFLSTALVSIEGWFVLSQ